MSENLNQDRYTSFVSSGIGRTLAAKVGLPKPVVLRRFSPGAPLVNGPALVVASGESAIAESLATALTDAGVEVVRDSEAAVAGETRLGAVILDATGLREPSALAWLRDVGAPAVKRLGTCGRVVVVGVDPSSLDYTHLGAPAAAATQQALEGFTRSLGKELRAGSTANLVQVQADPSSAVDAILPVLTGAVTFLASGRSAYVAGQVLRVGAPLALLAPSDTWTTERPLEGRTAVVTGAARGIGATIARVLARDGARVVAVDIPGAGESLARVANEISGVALQLDITAPDAPRRLATHPTLAGGLDLMVHNAGITRDKLFVNLTPDRWDAVMAVNLEAQLRIDDALLADDGPLRQGSRLVSVSSIAGIAGNRGQTNYGASKAGVVGMVRARAVQLAPRGITYNAVAPGFIETDMTAKVPLGTREAGRRLNSLSQGGQPVDVAEAIGYFGHPLSAGVTGQVLRVCGQMLLGA